MMRALASRLLRERRGGAAVEFALMAPIMFVGIMGVFDLGYNMYTTTVLQGAVQEAARSSSIEGASAAKLDERVTEMVHDIAPHAELSFSRKAYSNFSDVGQPEDYSDINKNGVCDDGEPFEDVNGNGTWDADRGTNGMGGARDAVLYEVTIIYPRPFPIGKLIGQSGEFSLVARTVLRNQPYGLQDERAGTGNCT